MNSRNRHVFNRLFQQWTHLMSDLWRLTLWSHRAMLYLPYIKFSRTWIFSTTTTTTEIDFQILTPRYVVCSIIDGDMMDAKDAPKVNRPQSCIFKISGYSALMSRWRQVCFESINSFGRIHRVSEIWIFIGM